jgi:hypothetical protein
MFDKLKLVVYNRRQEDYWLNLMGELIGAEK